ncbi:helix-turn-helix domain-containing protein [Streptomyces sp. NPDC059076]|uniref:helix-turn-helix domain-containing protein n=1 Tax=unclassified Streptomyces TaxID=2593676 RepID=UPI003699BC2E
MTVTMLTTLLGWDVRNPKDDPPSSYVQSGVWPNARLVPDAPPTAHIGQALARSLLLAIEEQNLSVRAAARKAGTTHPTLLRILDGTGLVDVRTVFLLEVALQAPLWPTDLFRNFALDIRPPEGQK